MAVLPKVNVVIVGLGAAGGIMAKELATSGLKVVGIEWGPLRRTQDFQWDHDELKYESRQYLLKPIIDEVPMTYRPDATTTAASSGVPWTISSGVGGGSIHYGTWNWRMLPHHFRIKSDTIAKYGANAIPSGTNVVDWPITYNDLAPYYDKVDTELGISGKAGNINGQIQAGGNPFEGPRSKDFPLPPLIQTTGSRIYSQAATALGYKPFPTPVGIISQAYDGRPGCDYCGFCSGYGCHVGAKSSTLVSVIPKAVASNNFEMRTGCRVIRINKSGGKATSVTYLDQAGIEQEQPAGLIIVSNYTWGAVRLLLLSGINANGLVGKYLMSHQYHLTNATFDTTITNTSEGPTGANASVDEFNGDNFDHTGLGFIEGASITSIGGNTHAITGTSSLAPGDFKQVAANQNWGQARKDFMKQYFKRTMGLIAQTPTLPYEANVIDLDPTVKDALGFPVLRVTYTGGDNEKKIGTFIQGKMTAILKQAGASATINGPLLMPPWNNHEVGPCRMGTDPTKSVVNQYLQSWELPNMFIVSGAVFPTYFGYNPTHTIEALSYWAAANINAQAQTGGNLVQYL
jgi:gluconate 2-dehydrogenase alpha chain